MLLIVFCLFTSCLQSIVIFMLVEHAGGMTVGYSGYPQENHPYGYYYKWLGLYETEIYDEGNAFSGDKFTCPVTGLYYVSYAIKCLGTEAPWFTFKVYRNTILAFSMPFKKKFDTAKFNMGLVLCNEGDIITVSMKYGRVVNLYGGEPATTLTVVLMRERGNIHLK